MYLIRKLQPDAVLLDMRLPDMTGLDIAGQIRSGELGVAPENPRSCVLTATLDPGDEQAFRRMGTNRWLLKPVQAGKLRLRRGRPAPIHPQGTRGNAHARIRTR